MDPIETILEKRFPGYRALTTSRGSTALFLALKAVADERGYGEVIVPSTVCPSVPFTIALSGFQPRFCDVDLEMFCLSPATIAPHLSERTKAIVAVYLFGKSFNPVPLVKLASQKGFSLIEDIAQAVGGEYEGRLLGGFGDFSVLSFDDTKIIRGTGGALLVRDGRFLERVLRHREALDVVEPEILRELSRGFRDLTMGLYDTLRSEEFREPADLGTRFFEKFRRLFIHQRVPADTDEVTALQDLSLLEREREARFINYSAYERQLRPDIWRVSFSRREMCWRLPVLANDHRQQLRIIERIRSEGGLVSNHYFPCSYAFGERGGENARQIGLRAVNLWVDSKVSEDDILRHCQVINELIV
ncbi:MAG TPA: DegT/DnrJ/EryC1/StrS family aminotransferase [bacterium]|nr:DegT/DnrJ/EryC1/StrS family aminotransferase [bacterium]